MTQAIAAKYAEMLKTIDNLDLRVWRQYTDVFIGHFPEMACVVIGKKPDNCGIDCEPREWIVVGPRGDYRTVVDLFDRRPDIVGRCSVLLNWVPANDEVVEDDFPDDVRAIAVLEPCHVLYRGSYDINTPLASYDGSPHLRDFLEDPATLGYKLEAYADLLENDAKFLGVYVTFQYIVRKDWEGRVRTRLPRGLTYEGCLYRR